MGKLLLRPQSIPEILRWAAAHRETTGKWPTKDAGGIPESRFETWLRVDAALRAGDRGLPGGSSLAQLLAEQRGVRNVHRLPPLTETQILAWADRHHQRTGSWPTAASGVIPESGGENWGGIDRTLRVDTRGIDGGTSLAQLLAVHRGTRNRMQLPALSEQTILAWADLHHRRTGHWPTAKSGPWPKQPGKLGWRPTWRCGTAAEDFQQDPPWHCCWRTGAGRATSGACPISPSR
jgi:hypothetical protein